MPHACNSFAWFLDKDWALSNVYKCRYLLSFWFFCCFDILPMPLVLIGSMRLKPVRLDNKSESASTWCYLWAKTQSRVEEEGDNRDGYCQVSKAKGRGRSWLKVEVEMGWRSQQQPMGRQGLAEGSLSSLEVFMRIWQSALPPPPPPNPPYALLGFCSKIWLCQSGCSYLRAWCNHKILNFLQQKSCILSAVTTKELPPAFYLMEKKPWKSK